jgi:NADPH:quinone reductase-like Zn-dependent oxidoreductase
MSRAVVRQAFGGPEVLEVCEIAEPHAGPGEIRIAVRAAGLNPLDWQIAAAPGLAANFGITVPCGFGCDLAGVVDEVGNGVTWTVEGDRVYGGVLARAVADFVVVRVPIAAPNLLLHTPDGISDETAAALPTPGLTAAAAVEAVGLRPGDTVLIGGAAGGVGAVVIAQLRHRRT